MTRYEINRNYLLALVTGPYCNRITRLAKPEGASAGPVGLGCIVPVTSVNLHFRHIRLDMHPVIFSSVSGAGRLVSDYILVAESPARFDSGFLRFGIISYTEVQPTGFFRQLFQQQGALAFSRLVDWFRDHAGTVWNAGLAAA